MPANEDEIYRSLKFNRDEVDFSQWPKLSCSTANELTLATKDNPNPGFARFVIAGELRLQIGVAVNELSSDEKLTNNSDLAIPTQKAVKTYVDNQITVVNQTLSTKAALNGAASQDFQSKNLSVSGNLTANGNVSIGTTTSSYKLAITAGDINIDDGRALRQAGRWVIGGDSNVLSIGSSNAPDGRDIRFDPGFSGALTIKKDTGNVGIGTANPETKLEVKGNLTLDAGGSPFLYTGTGNSELNRYLELLNSPARSSASGLKAGGILISDSYDYANPSKNDLIVKGNIGIGTPDPKAKLHVVGDLLGAAKGSGGEALRIAVGQTPVGATNWVQYGTDGIYVDINTSTAGFSSVLLYLTSIGGSGLHWATQGATSIYNQTATSFRVYVFQPGIIAAKAAKEWYWHINWIAIGN